MTLIQRQAPFVRVLERIYGAKFGRPEHRSRAVRALMAFNAKRMEFAGYSRQEADDSFRQCIDIARLNVGAAS